MPYQNIIKRVWPATMCGPYGWFGVMLNSSLLAEMGLELGDIPAEDHCRCVDPVCDHDDRHPSGESPRRVFGFQANHKRNAESHGNS